VEARAIDVDDRESEVVGLHGKGGGDREVVDRVAEELEKPIIPSSEDASRSPFRWFENEGAQGRWKKGGSEEGGDVVQLGFLKTQDRRKTKINSSSNIITLTTSTKTADIPALKKEPN
jgi:hypothetical protein